MKNFEKTLIIIGIVGGILVASYIGLLVFRLAWGLLIIGIFLSGGVVGYGIGRLIPRKHKNEE
jgi:hypothetical protein